MFISTLSFSKTMALALAATVAACLFTACNDSSSPPAATGPSASASAPAATFKIAVLSTGSATDGGWNQLAAEDLKKTAADLNATGTFLEKVTTDNAPNLMRDLAGKDYDLVIGHGYEFSQITVDVAKSLGASKTKFAVSGSDFNDANIVTLDFDLSQTCYQLGIIAAKVSKTGKIGFIGGERIPSLQSCYRGLKAGALSVNPSAQVFESYTSWDKPEDSKAQAETFIHQNVDVIFQNVDSASRGVFEAVKASNQEHPDDPVYTFGSNSDQNANPIASDFILASAVIKLDKAFSEVATSVKNGTFKAGRIPENLVNGTCVTVVNPALKPKIITPEIETLIDAAAKNFVSGQLTVPAQ